MGIDQVNRAVTQMDQVTQSNAAQTEELSLDGAWRWRGWQAGSCKRWSGRFKLGDGRARAMGRGSLRRAEATARRGAGGGAAGDAGAAGRRAVGRCAKPRRTRCWMAVAPAAGNGRGRHKTTREGGLGRWNNWTRCRARSGFAADGSQYLTFRLGEEE